MMTTKQWRQLQDFVPNAVNFQTLQDKDNIIFAIITWLLSMYTQQRSSNSDEVNCCAHKM